jgi:hypothetical protein
MLGPGRYLLGVAELGLIAGFAWLGASAVRRRLVPRLDGAMAHLATAVLGIALAIWVAELLGSFGFFEPLLYVAAVVVAGAALWLGGRGGWGRAPVLVGF